MEQDKVIGDVMQDSFQTHILDNDNVALFVVDQ